jgi:hypothetical protein
MISGRATWINAPLDVGRYQHPPPWIDMNMGRVICVPADHVTGGHRLERCRDLPRLRSADPLPPPGTVLPSVRPPEAVRHGRTAGRSRKELGEDTAEEFLAGELGHDAKDGACVLAPQSSGSRRPTQSKAQKISE